jgi:hypothetical protein
MQNITAQRISTSAVQPFQSGASKDPGYVMDPLKLAYLNFGTFDTLRKLGASRDRICSALLLSHSDFEYLLELTGAKKTTRSKTPE